MQKYISYAGLIMLLIQCKGEQPLITEANTIVSSSGVEIPVYNFDNFESFLKMNDGKTRVINFWATWCKPCVAELPYFELISSKYSDQDVEVILVSLDLPNQVESRLIPFVRRQKIQSKVILLDDPDADSWIRKINENWSGSIPATLIYNGSTTNFYEQSFTYNQLEKELKKIL